MNPPHVTHAIFDNEKAAVRASELLNEHYLPIKVVITGITVD